MGVVRQGEALEHHKSPHYCLFINTALQCAPGLLQGEKYTGKKGRTGQEEKGVRYDSPEWSQKAHECKVGGKQLRGEQHDK